jgi:hypothetical protein
MLNASARSAAQRQPEQAAERKSFMVNYKDIKALKRNLPKFNTYFWF